MKKLVKVLLPILTFSFLTSCSVGGGEPPKVETYPVFFDGNGGTLVEGQELQFVHDPSEIVPPTYEKQDSTFIGWDMDPRLAVALVKITAQWGEEGEFIVYFYGGAEDAVRIGGGEEKQIVKNVDEIVPPVYKREGYTFAGWSKDPSTVTETDIIIAKWDKEGMFIVEFDGNGGDYVSGLVVQTVSSADEIVPPKFKKPGCDFLGWDPPIDTITGETTVKAMWSDVSTYTIIWKNDDNTELEKDPEVKYGTMPTYDGTTPVKPNPDPGYTYTFAGWTPEVKEVTGDATYTATYKKIANTYTITWKNYDGAELEKDTGVPYGMMPTYNGATPTLPQTATTVYIWNGGWTPEVKEATDNATYTATYKEYDITGCAFEVNDGGTYTLTKYSGNKTKLEITPVYSGIPVTKIGDQAFESCTTLQEIVIPDSVLAIGEAAFSGCNSLTKINIPEMIKEISAGAFAACKNLTEITVPKNVTSINFYAFKGCSSLTTINMLPNTPPKLGPYAFDERPNDATFYVPKGCVSAYTSAGYNNYGKIAEKS